MRVLVLGGTREARTIAKALVDQNHQTTLALKGLTGRPLIPEGVRHRQGGFGGIGGLADFLTQSQTDLLIDATHPFAARMSWNAYGAAQQAGVRLCALQRPPWQRRPGDRWQSLSSLRHAALRLRSLPPKRILLALGGQGAEMFSGLPQHRFLARVLASSKTDLATRYGARWRGLDLQRLSGRPTMGEEWRTLTRFGADLMILRNAGGPLDAKLTAARRLNLPIWIIDRPAMPPLPIFGSASALLKALETA